MHVEIKQIADNLWQAPLHAAVAGPLPPIKQIVSMVQFPDVAIADDVDVLELPIDDNPSGTDRFDDLDDYADVLKDTPLMTVCHMGENRSGLFSAMVLVHRGVTPRAAVDTVQNNGPQTTHDHDTSFWNPGFVNQVLRMGDR